MPLDMRRLYLIFSLAVIVLSVLAGLLISGLAGDELGGRPSAAWTPPPPAPTRTRPAITLVARATGASSRIVAATPVVTRAARPATATTTSSPVPPSPTALPTRPPTLAASASASAIASPTGIASPTATAPLPATPTATVTLTSTPAPARSTATATAANTATAAPPPPAVSLAPQPTPTVISSPALIEPPADETLSGPILFRWLPAGRLPAGAAYEVVWWNQDEHPSLARGIAPPTTSLSLAANLDVLYHSNQIRGASLYWTVLVVQTSPYARLTKPGASEGRRLIYQPPGEPPKPR